MEDLKKTQNLISSALKKRTKGERWEIIRKLHSKGGVTIFEKAKDLCFDKSYKKRELGVDILGQLKDEKKIFLKETISIFSHLFETEKRIRVLSSLGFSCGHLFGGENLPFIDELVKLTHHKSKNVRLGSILGLLGSDDKLSIKAMVKCSQDFCAEVKSWATFGIGSGVDSKDGLIFNALKKSFKDVEKSVKEEAVLGLVNRGYYGEVKNYVLQEIKSGNPTMLILEAAGEFSDDEISNALKKLRKDVLDEHIDIHDLWFLQLEESIKKMPK